MAVPCRRRLIQFMSALCVTVCCIVVLRDIWLGKRGPRNDSQYLPRKDFITRLSYEVEGGRNLVKPSNLHQNNEFNLTKINKNVKPLDMDIFGETLKDWSSWKNINVIGLGLGKRPDIYSSIEQRKLRNSFDLQSHKHEEGQPLNVIHKSNGDMKDEDIRILTANLRDKLRKVSVYDKKLINTETCNSTTAIGNSCAKTGCLRIKLPSQLHTRIEQIVQTNHMQLLVSVKYKEALSAMAAQIPRHNDIIIVSAISSNHYLEGQAMLYNLHHNLFPHLTNFTFVYYNLGLTPAQRRYLANICRCVMIDFPFEMFPDFVSALKCYTWKPLIVNAAIQRAELVFWVDASIRFHPDPRRLLALLDRGRERGVQVGWSRTTISKTTLQSMFHFFGDEACAYVPYNQGLSGVAIFHNEQLIRRVVLEPWAACALSDQCMCPQSGVDLFQVRISCHEIVGENDYGVCHRFDQSALSILLTKLYQENVNHVMLQDIAQFIDIKRGDQREYGIRVDD